MYSEASGTLVFKFTLQQARSSTETAFTSLYLVELSSEALLDSLQKSKVKKTQEIPWGLRALEAAYDGNLMKALAKLLAPSLKSNFCFLFNHAQTEQDAGETLLQLSQFINEGESNPVLGSAAGKDKVSSGIKLILSKKSAKKSDQKKTGDKTSSRVEENPRRKELFR